MSASTVWVVLVGEDGCFWPVSVWSTEQGAQAEVERLEASTRPAQVFAFRLDVSEEDA